MPSVARSGRMDRVLMSLSVTILIWEPESKSALNLPDRPLLAVISITAVASRMLAGRAFADATDVEGNDSFPDCEG